MHIPFTNGVNFTEHSDKWEFDMWQVNGENNPSPPASHFTQIVSHTQRLNRIGGGGDTATFSLEDDGQWQMLAGFRRR